MQTAHSKTTAIRAKLQDTEEALDRWLPRLLRAANAVSRFNKRANYYRKLLADDAAREVKRLKQAQEPKVAQAAPLPAVPVTAPAVKPTSDVPMLSAILPPVGSTDLDIPTFLARGMKAQHAVDEAAKAAIIAEQQAKAKVKAKASSEKSRAKRRGELRKMPLSGKAALEAINKAE